MLDVTPRVSIIIVTYNSSHVILECLKSVPLRSDVEVIVIDNASDDDTCALIKDNHPRVNLICNLSNDGFAKAVNLAVMAARGKALLLLNPDAQISENVVDSLVQHLDLDPRLAVVAPVLSDGRGEFQTVSAGLRPSVRYVFNHFAGLSRLRRKFPWLSGYYLLEQDLFGEAVDVDWVSGGCLMVRKDDWDALGGLSERWFMYAEDVEFCLRIRQRGRVVRLLPQLHATHAIGGSSSNVDGRLNTAWIENLFDLYCWRFSRSRADQELWRSVVAAGFMGRAAVYGLRGLASRGDGRTSYEQSRKYLKFAVALSNVKPSQDRTPLNLAQPPIS